MSETYEQLVEREGGYYLSSRDGSGDVEFVAYCARCSAIVTTDDGDTYWHDDENEARDCWGRRRQ